MQFNPWDNPMGTDGFEFVEYAAPNPAELAARVEAAGVFEVVAVAQPASEPHIRGAHVLPPADELAHEALERGQRDVVRAFEGQLEHPCRRDEPDVEGRGEQGVEDVRVLAGDGVLVGAELVEPLVEERGERGLGLLGGDRPPEGVEAAGIVGELGAHPGDGVLHQRVGRG